MQLINTNFIPIIYNILFKIYNIANTQGIYLIHININLCNIILLVINYFLFNLGSLDPFSNLVAPPYGLHLGPGKLADGIFFFHQGVFFSSLYGLFSFSKSTFLTLNSCAIIKNYILYIRDHKFFYF